MLPYGGDRVRAAGGKIILHSSISKGWTPRRAKTNVHAEFPGTAVLWDDQYFEVISASLLPAGGVRYVLEPWREDHVIRVFDSYDEETEARRLADYRTAVAQRKKSVGARFAGIFLGHFPHHVQEHLEHELGVSPSTMSLLSTIPSVILLGTCAWLYSDSKLKLEPSPVPFWLWLVALALIFESGIRFHVAMSQSRGVGSLLGAFAYIAFFYLTPARRTWPSPFDTGRGNKLFTLPPPDDVALRDKIETRAAFLTLLTPAEQLRLAERFGFDYRKHAYGLTWIILIFSLMGVISSIFTLAGGKSVSALVSLIVAGPLCLEQIARLATLRRGPAGSFLGVLVRPFTRDLLERG